MKGKYPTQCDHGVAFAPCLTGQAPGSSTRNVSAEYLIATVQKDTGDSTRFLYACQSTTRAYATTQISTRRFGLVRIVWYHHMLAQEQQA
eukprot:2078380-Rhodomonas_salina.2